MRRKFGKKRKGPSEEVDLQITSLADVMVIILVFLLKTMFSADMQAEKEIDVSKDINLPTVTKGGKAEKGLTIEITSNSVRVKGRQVASLSRYRFPRTDLNDDLDLGNGTSKTMGSAMRRLRKKIGKKESRAWVIADQRAPFATIQTVLATAAQNGFSDFKLAVQKAQ